jgi:parvulin-like peptidyl-prolyl isomerase
MNKTLLIILGLAIAIGVAYFALTSMHPEPAPVAVPAPAVPVPAVPAPTASAPTAPAPAVSAPTASVPTEAAPTETATAPGSAPAAESIVAHVNGQPIAREALDQGTDAILAQYKNIYAQMGQNFQTLLAGADGFALLLGVQAQALERLTFTVIADAEVAERGLTVSADELNAEFETQYGSFLQSQGLTEEKLAELLLTQNTTLEAFKQGGRDSIENQLLMMKLQTAVAGPVELTSEEIQKYWDENRANYDQPEQLRASHILVKTEDEAKAILAELEIGGDFAKLAREKSTDTASAAKDGDLGWFGSGTMVQEFEDAAFALEVGQRSGIVETQYGYHIILLTDRKDAVQPELAAIRDQVEADAKKEIVAERANTWYSEVMAAADVTVTDPLLNAARLQRVNIDLGLEAYESLWQAGTISEPYLPYIVGTLYENRIQTLTRTKTQLEAAETPDPAKIAETTAQIADAKAKALAAYRDAVARSGGDADVQARIDALTGATTTAPSAPTSAEAAPTETATDPGTAPSETAPAAVP